MEHLENSSSNEEILNNNENPDNGQALTPEQIERITADNLALQSEYTRTRQALIESETRIAKGDPSYIASIKDPKLQNSVVKNLYGFETYSQAQAVLGNELNAKDGNESDSDDRTEKLEREIRLMKYNSSKSEVDNAIKELRSQSPEYFTDPSAEDKLRSELQFISGELPVGERIRRASVIAFSAPVDPTTLAYQVLNKGNIGSGGRASIDSKKAKDDEVQKQIEAGRALLGLPPKK